MRVSVEDSVYVREVRRELVASIKLLRKCDLDHIANMLTNPLNEIDRLELDCASTSREKNSSDLMQLEASLARLAGEIDDINDEKTIRYAAIIVHHERKRLGNS